MWAKIFKPTELVEGTDAKITLDLKVLGGNAFTHVYEHPYRSYDDIYSELLKDYYRHKSVSTFMIQFFRMVGNQEIVKTFTSFDDFWLFLKEKNLLENDLLEMRNSI